MYHGMTYADEAYSEETKGKLTINFWYPVMEKGIIKFPKPWECPVHKFAHKMDMKIFDEEKNNFSSIRDYDGEVE